MYIKLNFTLYYYYVTSIYLIYVLDCDGSETAVIVKNAYAKCASINWKLLSSSHSRPSSQVLWREILVSFS